MRCLTSGDTQGVGGGGVEVIGMDSGLLNRHDGIKASQDEVRE